MNSMSNLMNLTTADAVVPALDALPVAPALPLDIAALPVTLPVAVEGQTPVAQQVPVAAAAADFSFADAMQFESLADEALPVAEPVMALPVAEEQEDETQVALPTTLLSLMGLQPPQQQQALPLPVEEKKPQETAEVNNKAAAVATAVKPEAVPQAVVNVAPAQAVAAPRRAVPQVAAAKQDPTPVRTDTSLAPAPKIEQAIPVAISNVIAVATKTVTSNKLDTSGEVSFALPGTQQGFSALLNNTDTSTLAKAVTPALRLPNGDSEQWQSPLMQALGDRIQLQIAARSEQAVIRLDPPQMGRVEIAIRQDAGGALEVNLSASHGEVQRQLKQVSENLRLDLVQRHGGDVQVQVTSTSSVSSQSAARDSEGRPGQQRQARESEVPGKALAAEDGAAQNAPFALA